MQGSSCGLFIQEGTVHNLKTIASLYHTIGNASLILMLSTSF